jgi:hypothetical protein
MDDIKQEEKISYIYETLKKQESRYKRGFYYKWIFRMLVIWYLYYFIIIWLPGLMNNFKSIVTPDVSKSLENIDKEKLINKFKSLYNK